MSGPIHGEVLDLAVDLHRLGVSRNAIDALTVIAEGCRDHNRRGATPRQRIAGKLCATERTASRAVAELVDRRLVAVVTPGGGRARTGEATVYEIADLHDWLDDHLPDPAAADPDAAAPGDPGDTRPDPGDTQTSPRSPQSHASGGHPDVARMSRRSSAGRDRRDKSGRSAGHPDVSLPVPVGISKTPDATTGAPAPAPAAVAAAGRRPRRRPAVGSRCGRPDCRHPASCPACAAARRPEPAAAARDRARVVGRVRAGAGLDLSAEQLAINRRGLDAVRAAIADARACGYGRHARRPDPPAPTRESA